MTESDKEPGAPADEAAAPREEAPADAGGEDAAPTEAPAADEASPEAPPAEAAPADAAPGEAAPPEAAPPEAAPPEAVAHDGVPAEPAPAGAEAAAGDALRTDRIRLEGESGRSIGVGVRTPLGKHVVRQFGEDANAWDAEQCTLERDPDGAWQVVPNPGTTNETLLNGETLTGPRPLREGDVIAVGRAARGIAKLPLTVRAG